MSAERAHFLLEGVTYVFGTVELCVLGMCLCGMTNLCVFRRVQSRHWSPSHLPSLSQLTKKRILPGAHHCLFSTILCGNFEYFVAYDDDYDVDHDVDDDSDDDDGDGDGDGDDLYAGGVSRFPSSSRDC